MRCEKNQYSKIPVSKKWKIKITEVVLLGGIERNSAAQVGVILKDGDNT